jgi:5-formyltetrahydrofolate cyclo-ligase
MRALRGTMPAEARAEAAGRVAGRLFALPEVTAARAVLLFYSFGSEVPTSSMAQHLLDSGVRLLLPFLHDGAMEAAEVRPGESLVHSEYGPKEPGRRVPVDPVEVDVVITPGLAFDRNGRRLGYGGGHYDRYLKRLGTGALRAGIGFHLQVLDEVPAEPHDERVDVVVTDAETIECRNL